MAKIQSYTDASGVTHDQCYWRVGSIIIDLAGSPQKALIKFVGYADAEKRQNGNVPVPGAVKSYVVTGSKFADLYAKHMGTPDVPGENLSKLSYELAMTTLDKNSRIKEPKEITNPPPPIGDGKTFMTQVPVMESFFAHATDA